MLLSSCCICQEEILPPFIYLCKDCEETYGLNPADVSSWPEWAEFCYREERRRQYKDSIYQEHEISFSDCPEAEIIAYGEL